MLGSFELFGKEYSYYAVLALIGALLAGAFSFIFAKKRGLNEVKMVFLLLFSVIGVFIGGHLLYAVTNIDKLAYLPKVRNFMEFIYLMAFVFGGQVFYGGLLGGILAGVIYAKVTKLDNFSGYADIAACGIKVYRKYSRENYMLKYTKECCVDDAERKFYLCDVPETCNVWNKIYRTAFIKNRKIEFEAGIHMQEDISFTMETLYYSKKFVTVPGTLYNYDRRNENSIVKTKSLKMKQDVKYTQNKMFEFLKSNNINFPKTWHKVRKYKFLGITVLKVRYHSTRRECKLFNIIKFKLPPIYKYEEV